MSRLEIVEKLDAFLTRNPLFTEECHVIYLLVELRKILDRESNKSYPILRFYCNWAVHTDKKSTKEMESIMEQIYRDLYERLTRPRVSKGKRTKIIGFMYMEDLQAEMKGCLREYQLPNDIIEEGNWIGFVALLVRVLADQPINNPSVNIKQFVFLPTVPGCVHGVVYFQNKVGDYDHFVFGNTY